MRIMGALKFVLSRYYTYVNRFCRDSMKRDSILKNIIRGQERELFVIYLVILKLSLVFLVLLGLKSFLFRVKNKLNTKGCCKWIWSWKFLSENATICYILNISVSHSAIYGHIPFELESIILLLWQSLNRLGKIESPLSYKMRWQKSHPNSLFPGTWRDYFFGICLSEQ